MPAIPDTWEVQVTAPNGDRARMLVSRNAVELSIAHQHLNDFATAAAISVFDFATMVPKGVFDADTEGTADQPDGQRAGQDQAERPGEG